MTVSERVWVVLLGAEDAEGAIVDAVIDRVYATRSLADEYMAICAELGDERQPGAIPADPVVAGRETRWVEAWDVRARLWDETEE
jgi:hypothetical protein